MHVSLPADLVRPILAATLMLIRDGDEGIEVFMVQRHHQIEAATGALVFPGGKIEKNDYDERLRMRCQDADSFSDLDLAVRIGCLREAFEECGVLLAVDVKSSQPIAAEGLKAVQHARTLLASGALSFFDFIEHENLILTPKELVPFAHWITPEPMAKRFDTYFFIACAPGYQHAVHDGFESIDSSWVTPLKVIQSAIGETPNIMFPTRLNLLKLGQSKTVSAALVAAGSNKIVTICPKVRKDAQGLYLEIPSDAGYEQTTQRLTR